MGGGKDSQLRYLARLKSTAEETEAEVVSGGGRGGNRGNNRGDSWRGRGQRQQRKLRAKTRGIDIHNYARGCRSRGFSGATPHIHYTLTTVPMNNLRWCVTVSSIFKISLGPGRLMGSAVVDEELSSTTVLLHMNGFRVVLPSLAKVRADELVFNMCKMGTPWPRCGCGGSSSKRPGRGAHTCFKSPVDLYVLGEP